MEYRFDEETGSRAGDYGARRFKVIACKVMMRELYYLAYQNENIIDIVWMKQALHDTPEKLRDRVQATIDQIEQEEDKYDAILLGYGLCSNGAVGLNTKSLPLVIPRAHDCITLFLGSKERYQTLFDEYRGIYWYTQGWIESSRMPDEKSMKRTYDHYVEKYGEDNADYLFEMEQGWMKEYENAFFVEWPELPREDAYRFTRDAAAYFKWNCEKFTGSASLLRDMLAGAWDEERFLVLQPGQKVAPSFDSSIVKAED